MSRRRVLESISHASGERCVDIFARADGTFGFEEFRRDPEDPNGWYPIGRFAGLVYTDEAAARRAAGQAIGWLPR